MADLTIFNLASVTPPVQNWLGMQLLVMGNVTAGAVPTCVLQLESGGDVANGVVFTANTLWWARFGPGMNVNSSTAYQVMASAPGASPTGDTTVTIKQLYFTNYQVAITSIPANPVPLSFQVMGTYTPGMGIGKVLCRLLQPGTGVVGAGTVVMDQPMVGTWTASFNLDGGFMGCQLEAELQGTAPPETVAATWMDGINVGG
jgi:hypothetical protein